MRLLFSCILLTLHLGCSGKVLLGIDVLEESRFSEISGKRIGLLTNPSGVNGSGVKTLDRMTKASGFQLVALFAAEHGIEGDKAAGIEFKDSKEPRTGLPVYSLYGPGPTRKPTPAMLKGIDALIYDIQDTGCRSYTYIASMGMAMEACAEAGVEFIVLDRPNPLGGIRVEGPRLSSEFKAISSMVAKWNVPYVYGMTCGELARMINGEGWIKKPCRLSVIPMRKWSRSMTWPETGLTWVPTSPNIPRANSALFYASTGMLGEIGGVNIGNRLGLNFECLLAPWLDPERFCKQLNSYDLKGVRFIPFSTNYNSTRLGGARITFSDPARAPSLSITFYAMEAIKKIAGKDLFKEAVAAGRNFDMFDKVNGTTATRRMLQSGQSAESIIRSWRLDEQAFLKQRQKYLLY